MHNHKDREHGYWYHAEDDLYRCSICDEEIWILKDNATHVNYCPNCGAKMANHETKKIDPVIEAIRENNSKFEERPNIDFEGVRYDI